MVVAGERAGRGERRRAKFPVLHSALFNADPRIAVGINEADDIADVRGGAFN